MGKKATNEQKERQQKETKWRPNPKQIAIADLLLNPEDRRTKTEKINEVGVSRKAFYSWMKDERFINYLNSQIDQYTNAELADVWRALLTQAKRGNIQHIKLFFEMKGLYVERHELTGKDGKPIEVAVKLEDYFK